MTRRHTAFKQKNPRLAPGGFAPDALQQQGSSCPPNFGYGALAVVLSN
jgi:hypothetical protein